MPYVTSFERLSLERGLEQGRVTAARESVAEVLVVRFGALPPTLTAAISAEENADRLRSWHRLAITVPSVTEFMETIRERTSDEVD